MARVLTPDCSPLSTKGRVEIENPDRAVLRRRGELVAVHSAGILLYRLRDAGERQVWIAHMGGPFWARKQAAAWSIPKGEEEPFVAARREFEEEIGVPAPDARYVSLGDFRQPSGKIVTVFAAEADFILDRLVSNTFELEWPKGSGVLREFPEVDDARWVGLAEARVKLVRGQLAVLNVLEERLRAEGRLFE
jgi:predicted NUDIX family NTP pyrophosphohydrolase